MEDINREWNKLTLPSVSPSIADLTVADPSPIWSYPVSDLKVGIFPPFLVSNSITVSRVLKIDDWKSVSSQIEIDLVLKNIDLCLASTPLMPLRSYSFLNFRYFFFTISWVLFVRLLFSLNFVFVQLNIIAFVIIMFHFFVLSPFDVVCPVMNVLFILLCMFNFWFFWVQCYGFMVRFKFCCNWFYYGLMCCWIHKSNFGSLPFDLF